MRASTAVVYDLSRTLDLVVLPNGTAMLLRNERPAFKLSDAETRNLAAAVARQPVAQKRQAETRTVVGRCGDCGAEAVSTGGAPARIRHSADCPSSPTRLPVPPELRSPG